MGLGRKLLDSARDVARIPRAGAHSARGFSAAMNHEAAFRQEIIVFFILAPLGWWLGADGVERSLLVGSLVLVPIIELLNSSVEATVDRIGKERHELSGRAKDMGSAAVLLSLLLVVFVWASILVPRYL
ncbi:MAG: diacylglycerol kinase [Acidithiobacillales bacterium SM23_46]|jgi:diacylglycerol kinase (ATP)|nr:MAG: diacylglycerol kinase [Thiotrichales bacterium SG8_50]KPK73983.1 MAG: diacylglycerol kinase [Acidithiobacillales bacterium SM23_46]KPL28918.1 MAG: diacylglycerol kinase [Acidithiobacillales bacterium SM1_46]